jgi:SM-20-related protein
VNTAGLERIVDDIASHGYSVAVGLLEAELVSALRSDLEARGAAGDLRSAAVGAGAARAVRPDIRGDRISWIDPPETAAEASLFARLEALRLGCNRELQLGVSSIEAHYAEYVAGRGYARHLDRSPAGSERVLSVVCYLNSGWSDSDGGALLLETAEGIVRIAPHGGTVVTFLSDRFAHTVEPCARTRHSIAGWFSRRPILTPAL